MTPAGPTRARWVLVGVAVVAAIGALALQHRYLSQQRLELEQERQRLIAEFPKPIEVLVAGRDIPRDTVIEPSMLSTATVPERFVQPYAVRSARDVVGLVTVAQVAAGEQILTTKLRRQDEAPAGSTLSSLTPKGKRAVTIIVDTLSGVGGFVRPGDVVDILWTAAIGGAAGQAQSQGSQQVVTLTMFQDIPVLAVGREFSGARAAAVAKDAKDAEAKKEGAAEGQFTVTLALTPQEAAFLLVAREQGRVQLSLRSRNDTGTVVSVAPADLNSLVATILAASGQPPSAAHSAQAASREVEVYKGLKREVVVLPERP